MTSSHISSDSQFLATKWIENSCKTEKEGELNRKREIEVISTRIRKAATWFVINDPVHTSRHLSFQRDGLRASIASMSVGQWYRVARSGALLVEVRGVLLSADTRQCMSLAENRGVPLPADACEKVGRATPSPPAAFGRLRRRSAASVDDCRAHITIFRHAGHLLTDF